MDVRVGLWRRLSIEELMLSNCGAEKDSWESLGQQGDQISQSQKKSTLTIHWKDWCWSWSSNTLTTWCEELNHWKRPWRWERLRAGEEVENIGWDGWMASLTQWTWVWENSEIEENREPWFVAIATILNFIRCNFWTYWGGHFLSLILS